MKDIESKQRRKLLLLAGALAAQASLPMRVARAVTLPSPLACFKDLLKRYTASIVPVPLNPYFVPQGSALAVPRPAGAPFSGAGLPGSATQTSTLVLYDTTGPWGWLGEIYATMAGNLASHFGAWVACQSCRTRRGLSTVLDLYLHRLNLRRAITSGIPDGTSTRQRPRSFGSTTTSGS